MFTRVVIVVLLTPVVWAESPLESALTNKPVSISDTVLVPAPAVPYVTVPQARPIDVLPATGVPPAPRPPARVSSPGRLVSPVPITSADLARRAVGLVPSPTAPPLPELSTLETNVAPVPKKAVELATVKRPVITAPILFNTMEADAILSELEIFPTNNLWHAAIANWPVHANSENIIAAIGDRRPLTYNMDMGFVLVPPDQTLIHMEISPYSEESDLGPYPVPDNLPIEGWPAYFHHKRAYQDFTLEDVQRDRDSLGGDRHAIVVDPVKRVLYEFFQMRKIGLLGWHAAQASIFDLKTNKLRPDGWTSADAAGLPIFPAVVRYDELQRGHIDHALRVTVPKTRRAYVAPATHFASSSTDDNLPRMGERLRLKPAFDASTFSQPARVILEALKTHGMFVADNGAIFAISIAPDERMPLGLDDLEKVRVADFDVVSSPTDQSVTSGR